MEQEKGNRADVLPSHVTLKFLLNDEQQIKVESMTLCAMIEGTLADNDHAKSLAWALMNIGTRKRCPSHRIEILLEDTCLWT